jgi:hypothetical protein
MVGEDCCWRPIGGGWRLQCLLCFVRQLGAVSKGLWLIGGSGLACGAGASLEPRLGAVGESLWLIRGSALA